MTSLEAISIPSGISYDELKTLSNGLTGVVSEIASARTEWENQTSPFFILTMRRIRKEFDKLVELNREMKEFVGKKYDKARRIEESAKMIGKIRDLSAEVDAILHVEKEAHQELSELEKRMELASSRLDDLEKTPVAIELQGIEGEGRKDSKALHSELEGLRRPLKKMMFLVKRGQLEIKPGAAELLKRCEDGIDIRRVEEVGVMPFRSLMETMREALEANRLSLKKEDRARVARALNALLDKGILEVELEKSRRDHERVEKLLSSEEGNSYQKKKLDLKMEVDRLAEQRKKELEEIERIKKRLQEKGAEVRGLKARIEENVSNLFGERIEIRFE